MKSTFKINSSHINSNSHPAEFNRIKTMKFVASTIISLHRSLTTQPLLMLVLGQTGSSKLASPNRKETRTCLALSWSKIKMKNRSMKQQLKILCKKQARFPLEVTNSRRWSLKTLTDSKHIEKVYLSEEKTSRLRVAVAWFSRIIKLRHLWISQCCSPMISSRWGPVSQTKIVINCSQANDILVSSITRVRNIRILRPNRCLPLTMPPWVTTPSVSGTTWFY